jgi:Mg-chelatase subunit ChlD
LKELWKINRYGSTVIPFICSLKAGKIQIPDNVAQHQFFDHKRAPLDLILALDISGSMAGSKLKLLKEAVKLIMNQLNDKDRISIVTFNNRAQRITPLQLLTTYNKGKITQKLNSVKASGGTNIAEAMDICFNIFK